MAPPGAITFFRSRLRPVLAAVARPVAEFVFPPACLACGLPLQASGRMLCDACERGMKRIGPDDQLFRETRAKLAAGGLVENLIAGFSFEKEGPIQGLIHQLKYGGMTRVGVELGKRLGQCILARGAVEDITAVLPVPLHIAKLRERGYNQSEELCRGIASVTGLTVDRKLLWRNRYTSTQTALDIAERERNVAGAFSVRLAAVPRVREGKFLVVDDVITTGATVRACAAALRANGAGRVVASAVALAS